MILWLTPTHAIYTLPLHCMNRRVFWSWVEPIASSFYCVEHSIAMHPPPRRSIGLLTPKVCLKASCSPIKISKCRPPTHPYNSWLTSSSHLATSTLSSVSNLVILSNNLSNHKCLCSFESSQQFQISTYFW
jgi:hypothetical protein